VPLLNRPSQPGRAGNARASARARQPCARPGTRAPQSTGPARLFLTFLLCLDPLPSILIFSEPNFPNEPSFLGGAKLRTGQYFSRGQISFEISSDLENRDTENCGKLEGVWPPGVSVEVVSGAVKMAARSAAETTSCRTPRASTTSTLPSDEPRPANAVLVLCHPIHGAQDGRDGRAVARGGVAPDRER